MRRQTVYSKLLNYWFRGYFSRQLRVLLMGADINNATAETITRDVSNLTTFAGVQTLDPGVNISMTSTVISLK
jgi:hypothetical protein